MVPGRRLNIGEACELSPRAESETANLGGRVQKGHYDGRAERIRSVRKAPAAGGDNFRVYRWFDGMWRESILGSEQHWVCGPTVDGSAREVDSFGGTTAELMRLAEWLKARQVESVALESTGVYWIAPHEVLEGQGLQVLLVDTRQLARVPVGTRNQTRRIASGSSGCTVADCCAVRFGRKKRCACCGRWYGIRRVWWRRGATGCGGCKRAWTR